MVEFVTLITIRSFLKKPSHDKCYARAHNVRKFITDSEKNPFEKGYFYFEAVELNHQKMTKENDQRKRAVLFKPPPLSK